MTVTLLSNKPAASATFHINAANATIVVAGNSATSNVASANVGTGVETLTGGNIRKVIWGTDSGSITISRGTIGGANNVLVLTQSGSLDFAAMGCPISVLNTANVVTSFTSANAFVIIEISKIGSLPTLIG